MELVGKKEFAAIAFNPKDKTFVVHVTSFASTNDVHFSCRAQIAFLKVDEASIIISSEYFDFVDIFSLELIAELLGHMRINNHTINLIDGKQPLYRPIYNLGPLDMETLETYIKTNLAHGFIRPSKSSASTPILFVQKFYSSFCLCINYQALNTLTIENCYLLPLIDEFLDRLGRAK